MCIRDRVGSAMGSAHMVGPVLLAEIAPPKWRGSITLCHQLVVTVGILFAKLLLLLFGNKDDNIDGCHCLSDASLAWMHAVLFIPPIIQLACQCWMPESPRIVLRRHGAQLAAIELEGLRPKHYSQHDAQDEMVAMMEEFQAEDPESWLCAELMGHSQQMWIGGGPVSYTHLRAHETPEHLVCRLLLEKKKKNKMNMYVMIYIKQRY
eukprot:TRINITY_DN22871_c0_g1_i3.p1 TRINITY_DN22871_c0_g1~~TRINITY_DN22871_c0_g1_i3.p1  ORF type:complete len:207 (+),score=48.47 TRINITY_DN22871_c0_g1_i3:159-779(+)